jgi:hypothetical protein
VALLFDLQQPSQAYLFVFIKYKGVNRELARRGATTNGIRNNARTFLLIDLNVAIGASPAHHHLFEETVY